MAKVTGSRRFRVSVKDSYCMKIIVLQTIDVKNVGKIIKNVKKRKKRYKNKKR